ncbi:MAG: ribosomal protein S18-alanine N-acetyltransferase [Burkholderiales bacterium]
MQIASELAIGFRPMQSADLDRVLGIERDVYEFPWTPGNFNDCLRAGYFCRILELDGESVGYAVMTSGAGEAQVLNLAISKALGGKGLGERLLRHMVDLAREAGADTVLLEVRVSNKAARRLYATVGFNEIALRRNYYPARVGREDAIVMGLAL